MPYRCTNCDNNEFRAYRGYTEEGTQRIYFNSDGDIVEQEEREEDDITLADDWDNLECCECGSTVMWGDDDDETDDRNPPPINPSISHQTNDWRRRITGE